jgi:hypothetical protein
VSAAPRALLPFESSSNAAGEPATSTAWMESSRVSSTRAEAPSFSTRAVSCSGAGARGWEGERCQERG